MKFINLSLILLLCLGYSNHSKAQCQAGETLILFNLVPDNWGSEITWQFTGPGGTPMYASGGPYTDNNNTPINVNVCVPTGSQVFFTISDAYGDGICCASGNGSYTVSLGGINVATGGNYGSSESTVFFAPLLAYDISMKEISSPFPVVGSNENLEIEGRFKNSSSSIITEISLSYQAGNEPVVTENFSSLNIAPGGFYNFNFASLWTPLALGNQTLKIWANSINSGNADMYPNNDSASMAINVYQGTTIPNILDDFLTATPTYSTIATASNQVNKPTDLDFHTILSRNELWVLNENTENSGGSTVTISDAGKPTQSTAWKRDGNAWHFMSLPTGIAFGTNGNWATSPGVFDANHNGGAPFTGPSLWSSDMSIYAQNAGPGTNGSHLDMLHETPYGMGIAHHKGNAYWLFDGNASNIIYYDFKQDHGPGQDYHGDAIIRRYAEVSVLKDSDVPSHLILDKATGWLYIADTGNDRILRMNTNTGNFKNNLTQTESVVEYSEYENVVSETVIDTGLVRPCGIDLVDDRLIVGDYTTGDIRFYDISVNPVLYLGKISTGAAGLTGLKVGPEGNIWFTNKLTHEVKKIMPSAVVGLTPIEQKEDIVLYPNPANTQFNVKFPASFDKDTKVQIVDALGRTIVSTSLNSKSQLSFDCSNWAAGVYLLSVQHGTEVINKKIQVH